METWSAFSFGLQYGECGAGALAREGCLRVGTQGSPTTSDNLPASEPTLPLPDSVGCIRISLSDSHPTATHDRRIPLPRPDRQCEEACLRDAPWFLSVIAKYPEAGRTSR